MVDVAVTLIAMVLPFVASLYAAEKIAKYREHWFVIPTDWRLPKVEVACWGASVGSLLLVAVIFG